ncbi:MAG TPA: class I SAM-dependent methyltransferase [Streptosporangiaceae bacterium]
MVDRHDDVVRREFTRQAPTFTAAGWAASGLDWITDQIGLESHHQVLEVAAGAAHLGRALARHAAHVTAIDLTPAVLQRGKAQADADGQQNVVFEIGNAADLPYLDASFDVVVSRLAVHHFRQPEVPVSEMVRVCRPTGRIFVVDMVAEPDTRGVSDHLERLRDPSHTRTLTLEEVTSLLSAAGGSVTTWRTRPNPLLVTDWLDRTSTPQSARDEITTALLAELDGGPATGLRPHRRDGDLWLEHEWVAVTAVPAGPAT